MCSPTTEDNSAFVQYLNVLSSIVTESIYVIDVATNRFCYVSPNDLFLCGHSVEDAMVQGNDFYKRVVHCDDLRLWEKMYNAIFLYFENCKERTYEVDYFSCTCKLQRNYAFHPRPLPQMVCHKMKPVWVDGKLRYLFCTVGSSTLKESGNLCMHDHYGLIFEYNPATLRWKQHTAPSFTERERVILMLAQQGKNAKEIANCLFKSHRTIRNQLKPIITKLNVHSLMEAVDIASNNHLIYDTTQIHTEPALPSVTVSCKRPRKLLTEDMFQRIQQYLDGGVSIRQAAKLEGVAECAIRYWIGKGKLCGCSSALKM